MLEPARGLIGYSQAIMPNPMTKLMICNIGIGMTMGLSDLVKKSKKILGQRKPSNAAHTWSVKGSLSQMLGFNVRLVAGRLQLTCSCGEDDEASPVVLDKSAHVDGWWSCCGSRCASLLSRLSVLF